MGSKPHDTHPMPQKLSQETCQEELESNQLIPRKYYGQVFTTDPEVIDKLIETIKSLYKPGAKIVEIGGGLGYISEKLIENFDAVEIWEFDEEYAEILNKKFEHEQNSSSEKIKIIQDDILNYPDSDQDYLLVGNIPFHISGKLYRKFMSDMKNKPYGMAFITDKQYANTLMGQPPRCYRISLQAQAYGDIEIISDVPPRSVYPEPKVTCCIMKISENEIELPENFWKVVNYHWENFPTKEVESPKTMGLNKWIKLANNQ